MTRDDAVTIILTRCGMRQNDKKLQAACVMELVLAQQTKLERAAFKPWFLLSEDETTITLPGEARIPLPRFFLQEYEHGSVWLREYFDDREDTPGYVPMPFVHIPKLDETQLIEKYQYSNRPAAYTIVNNYLTVAPVPNGTYLFKMKYYKAATVINAEYGAGKAENEWLRYAPDWLIGETGAIIAGSYIKDAATAAEFKAQAASAQSSLYVEHCARDEANRVRSMGDD